MNGRPKQGFIFSLLLHAGVAATVLLLSAFSSRKEETRTVFTFIAPPPPGSPDAAPVGDAMADQLDATVPPAAPEPIPARPEPVKPAKPPPTKPPVRPPPPKPVATIPTPPKKTIKPPERKPPESVDYSEFVKEHGKPQPNKPAAPRRAVVAKPGKKLPKIDTHFGSLLRETLVDPNSLGGMSGTDQSELASYVGRLTQALRTYWDKPEGLADTMTTIVEFQIRSDGKFLGVHVVKSSGNAQFDQSVLEAFRELGDAGDTPTGKSMDLRFTFRMTDV